MKKTIASDAKPAVSDDLRSEYQLDYNKARPNRFVGRISRDRVVVLLDADVSKVFTTPESVNTLLRALISAMPAAPKKARTRS